MNSSPVYENFVASQEALARLPDAFQPFHARYDAYRPRLHFLSDVAGGYCESFHLDSGLVMLVMNVDLAAAAEVQLRGQDIVEFHFRLSGSLEMRGGWGHLSMQEPSMLLWRQPRGCDDVGEVIGARRPREVSVSLYCDPEWLAGQVGGYCPAALFDFLRGEKTGLAAEPVYRLYDLAGCILDVVNDIIASPFQGRLRYLYAKGRALELLCRTVHTLAAEDAPQKAPARLRERDRRSILMAHDILRKEYVAAPSLNALARRVGVSASKLSAGFKQEFGDTVSDCLRKIRLEQARTLLESSDLQIGQIACSVGYKHHSTFTAAFTGRFGVAPKKITTLRGTLPAFLRSDTATGDKLSITTEALPTLPPRRKP